MTCVWCSALIDVHDRGPKPRYCSGACRQSAFRARHGVRVVPADGPPYICDVCGALVANDELHRSWHGVER